MHNKAGERKWVERCQMPPILFTTLATSQKTWRHFLQNKRQKKRTQIFDALTYDGCQVEIIKSFPVYVRVLVIFSPSESNGPENVSFIHT